MGLNGNDGAVCTDSINAQSSSTGALEIDLYEELIAFAEMSPDEQLRLVRRPEKTSAKEAGKQTSPEPVPTRASTKPVEAKAAAAEATKEHTSFEAVLTEANQPVEHETAVAEKETPTGEEPAENNSSELVLRHAPIKPVESDAAIRTGDSRAVAAISKAHVEPGEVRRRQGEGLRPSGPLSGFNLPPNIVYTGALSRGICLACGAASGVDDLFCITCGVFMDEVGSTITVKPTCVDCNKGIAPDEIFCPWCGSVLPG